MHSIEPGHAWWCIIHVMLLSLLGSVTDPVLLSSLQLGALTWFMAVVTVQLALPHKAVYRVSQPGCCISWF